MKKTEKQMLSLLLVCVLLSGSAFAAEVVPLGIPVGVRMTAEGVVISSLTKVDSPAGELCPAELAGLRSGDILQTADGSRINSSEQLAEAVAQGDGKPMQLTGTRDGTKIAVTIQPVQSSRTGCYQLGLLIRDSMAGIGTLTYADPQSNAFGALGHPISDIDSGALLPLASGSVIPAEVIGVVAGESGKPGELVGAYDYAQQTGQLHDNTACGIFGTLQDAALYDKTAVVQTAALSEVHSGEAEVLTCIHGTKPQTYAIEIERVDAAAADGRNLSIRITDAALLGITGGIVPGMSGSPILQDGRLVGAVTHTLLNDPERGFGIGIEVMLDAAE